MTVVVTGAASGIGAAVAARLTEVIAFLLSDAASYITGAEIPVDGGAGSHHGAKSISDALRS